MPQTRERGGVSSGNVSPTASRTSIAHTLISTGHLGVQKTTDKITSSFYWLGVQCTAILLSITTEAVAAALVNIYSTLDISEEVLSVLGTQVRLNAWRRYHVC